MHTKGPWSRNIKPAKKYAIIFAGRNTHVAQLCTSGLADEEIEGNCDLIAGAPALLEAAEAFLANCLPSLDSMPSIGNLRQAVRAAKGERD